MPVTQQNGISIIAFGCVADSDDRHDDCVGSTLATSLPSRVLLSASVDAGLLWRNASGNPHGDYPAVTTVDRRPVRQHDSLAGIDIDPLEMPRPALSAHAAHATPAVCPARQRR